jgi:hypothetical protein
MVLPAVFPLLVATIAIGVWLVLARIQEISPQLAIGVWLVISVPLAVWLVGVVVLARAGVYEARPAIPISALLPPLIGLFLLSRLPVLPQLLGATPPAWVIGVQVVRVAGGVFLLIWLSREVARPWFNVVAGSLDLFIGVTALPLALWVSSGSPLAVTAAVVWNLIGLLDFALATTISATVKGAGPSTYLVSHDSPTVGAFRPTILGIVAYGVPLVIMIHALSLWLLLAT